MPRVAYIMSRFPKLTETFILYEILALEEAGTHVDVYPLLRQREPLAHPEATALVSRARYLPFLSPAIFAAQVRQILRTPRVYLETIWTIVRATWGNWNYLIGGLAIFPKSVFAAQEMFVAGIEHVHAHFANHPTTAAYIISRFTGIPYSFTAHGSDLHRDQRMLLEKVSSARFVVAISDYNRKMIEEHCGAAGAGKTIVLHCGVDRGVFRAAEPDRSNPLFTIVCVGTIHEVKGQRYLIDACRILRDQGIAFKCNFVGDGIDRGELEKYVERIDLSDRVRILGSRTRAEIAELLRSSDVAVTPSVPTRNGDREGIPVVLMEAMASGLPVVASDLSGIPELVQNGKHGILTPPGDATAIAAALRRLSEEPMLRRQLGEAGRQRVLEHFDVRVNARLLQHLFAESHMAERGSHRMEGLASVAQVDSGHRLVGSNR